MTGHARPLCKGGCSKPVDNEGDICDWCLEHVMPLKTDMVVAKLQEVLERGWVLSPGDPLADEVLTVIDYWRHRVGSTVAGD